MHCQPLLCSLLALKIKNTELPIESSATLIVDTLIIIEQSLISEIHHKLAVQYITQKRSCQ